MAMDPLSWDGWYSSEDGAEWVEATLWIEDDHIGIGLTRSWTLEQPIPLVDVTAVHAVGRETDSTTSLEITLAGSRQVRLRAPTPFVELLIRTLRDESVVAVTPPVNNPASVTAPISCIECGEEFATLDEMRTHASKHLPTVEFVPLPSV